MSEWAEGRWCDVCHQKHYQISPSCLRRRRERAELASLAAMIAPQVAAPVDRRQLAQQAFELREALKRADTLFTERRAAMDNQARARDYRGLASTATVLAKEAQEAQRRAELLDKVMTTLAQKPGG